MALPEQNLIKHGYTTPRARIFKSESHKLCQAFTLKKGTVILQGMPVKLNEDGEIEPFYNEGNAVYLGIAITDSINPAYRGQRDFPEEVTVMVEGFAIVHAIANGEVKAGYVETTDQLVDNRFVKYAQAVNKTKFIALQPAEANGLIEVLVR